MEDNHLVNVFDARALDLADEALVVRIDQLQLLAGRGVDELSVDEELRRERDVHLVHLHLDGFEHQRLLLCAAALDRDHHAQKVAEGRGHEDILVGDGNFALVFHFFDQPRKIILEILYFL